MESRDLKNKTSGNRKKTLLIITLVILALIVAMYLLLLVLEKGSADKDSENIESNALYSDFESADFDYNIFEDSDYNAIVTSEFIKFYDEYTNMTIGVSDIRDAYSFGQDVGFLAEYIYSIIEGDYEKYNQFFSSAYYDKHQPIDRFTMQKVYDVIITRKVSSRGESESFNTYYCALEYKILDNNGTFRQDIKDGYKTQYIVITDREGRLLIDSIN